MEAFCGIDVACAKAKLLPVVVCVREGTRLRALPLRMRGPIPPRGMGNRLSVDTVTRQNFASAAVDYLAAVERQFAVRIVEVAIDAPRSPSAGRRRAAEREMDRLGISCIATPSYAQFEAIREKVATHLAAGGSETRLPHANQLWMLVGFDLFNSLGTRYNCIEVFPNAIVHAVAPDAAHKSTSHGFERQLQAVASAADWNPAELFAAAYGTRHDKLDAFMSAWIASLPLSQRVAYGDGAFDTIWSVRTSTAPLSILH